jgi:hypothetical protein
LVSKIQVATTNAGARAQGGLTPDFLALSVTLLRELNSRNMRRIPDEAPTGFIHQRWEKHVFTKEGIDRRFYETCMLSELGKAGLIPLDISTSILHLRERV